MASQTKILITGATGYLGKRLACELLRDPNNRLLLTLRAADPTAFGERCQKLGRELGATEQRVSYIHADLSNPADLDQLDATGISRIYHAAAVTRFNVEQEIAQTHNVKATRHLLNFARSCPRLRGFHYISSIYASGMASGQVEEQLIAEEPEFANHYEASKWQCEQMLASEFDDLAWNIFRVATIIADDDLGKVTQHNAVHNTLKLFYYGLISLIPGNEQTPLYLVTGDFAARAIAKLSDTEPSHGIFNVSYERKDCVKLGEFIDLAFATFCQDEGFKRKGIKKPLYVDERAFELLASGVSGFGGAVVTDALASIRPFARQLFIDKDVRNTEVQRGYGNYRAPEPRSLLHNVVQSLVASRWGRV